MEVQVFHLVEVLGSHIDRGIGRLSILEFLKAMGS